ncbi:hypothetical protein pEaSNUABM11_00246 [Erwinia phage pEa_SNUABM_11]|nr:hypothetical protein pEaSNUABM11_00246 [Erwinia phage pEa_SNUABM_11]
MTLNPIAALQAFASKASVILPKGFTTNDQELALTTYDDMSGMANWMQKEKFLNFQGMLVPVPPGFNTYVMDHMQRLESTWDTLQTILPGVLQPIDKLLASMTHQKGVLTLPVGFRFKDFKYPLKAIDPKDLVAKLAQSYTNNVIDQRAIEKTYHSAAEIDTAFNRAKALRDDISKKLRKDVSRLIGSISASAAVLENEPVHPQVVEQLTLALDMASNWVELFGLFMKQSNELLEALNATAERLKALRENKK